MSAEEDQGTPADAGVSAEEHAAVAAPEAVAVHVHGGDADGGREEQVHQQEAQDSPQEDATSGGQDAAADEDGNEDEEEEEEAADDGGEGGRGEGEDAPTSEDEDEDEAEAAGEAGDQPTPLRTRQKPVVTRLERNAKLQALYKKQSAQHLKSFPLDSDVRCMAVVGESVWVASRDGAVHVRDMQLGTKEGEVVALKRGRNTAKKFYVGAIWKGDTSRKVWLGSSDGILRSYSTKGKLLHELTDHQGGIKYISGTRECFWTASEDFTIWQRSARDGAVLKQMVGHTSWVQCMVVSPTGELWSGSVDGIRIWDTAIPYINEDSPSQPATTISSNADIGSRSRTSSTASSSGRAHSRSVSRNRRPVGNSSSSTPVSSHCVDQLMSGGHDGPVLALLVVEDTVWSGGADGQICVWSASDHSLIKKFSAHRNWVYCLKLVEQDVWSASFEEINVWDRKSCAKISDISLDAKGKVADIAYNNGRVWVGCRNPGSLHIYRIFSQRGAHRVSRFSRTRSGMKLVPVALRTGTTSGNTTGRVEEGDGDEEDDGDGDGDGDGDAAGPSSSTPLPEPKPATGREAVGVRGSGRGGRAGRGGAGRGRGRPGQRPTGAASDKRATPPSSRSKPSSQPSSKPSSNPSSGRATPRTAKRGGRGGGSASSSGSRSRAGTASAVAAARRGGRGGATTSKRPVTRPAGITERKRPPRSSAGTGTGTGTRAGGRKLPAASTGAAHRPAPSSHENVDPYEIDRESHDDAGSGGSSSGSGRFGRVLDREDSALSIDSSASTESASSRITHPDETAAVVAAALKKVSRIPRLSSTGHDRTSSLMHDESVDFSTDDLAELAHAGMGDTSGERSTMELVQATLRVKISKLEAALKDKQKELDEAELEKTMLAAKYEEKAGEVMELREENELLREKEFLATERMVTELAETEEKTSQSLEAMKKRCAMLEEELDQLHSQNDAAVEAKDTFAEMLQETQAHNHQLEETIEAEAAKTEELVKELEQAGGDFAELKAKYKKLKKKYKQKGGVDEEDAEIDDNDWKAKAEALTEQLTNKERQYEDLYERHRSSRAAMKKLRYDIDAFREVLVEEERKRRDLTRELAKARGEPAPTFEDEDDLGSILDGIAHGGPDEQDEDSRSMSVSKSKSKSKSGKKDKRDSVLPGPPLAPHPTSDTALFGSTNSSGGGDDSYLTHVTIGPTSDDFDPHSISPPPPPMEDDDDDSVGDPHDEDADEVRLEPAAGMPPGPPPQAPQGDFHFDE